MPSWICSGSLLVYRSNSLQFFYYHLYQEQSLFILKKLVCSGLKYSTTVTQLKNFNSTPYMPWIWYLFFFLLSFSECMLIFTSHETSMGYVSTQLGIKTPTQLYRLCAVFFYSQYFLLFVYLLIFYLCSYDHTSKDIWHFYVLSMKIHLIVINYKLFMLQFCQVTTVNSMYFCSWRSIL